MKPTRAAGPRADVHTETGGRCRRSARTCTRACRYRLPSGEMGTRCALDVAAMGPLSLDDVGRLLGITKQAVYVAERQALERFARKAELAGLEVGEQPDDGAETLVRR